jgi:putative transcriptional regulator
MIVCRLADMLAERGMSRRELARRSGLNMNTVCKLANDEHTLLHVGVLEAVCKVLGVQPGEVLHYVPGNEASTCSVRLLA